MPESNDMMRFIELVIAATIGTVVGTYIAKEINLADINLWIRAVFAVAILAVFFFLLNKASKTWGKKGKTEPKPYRERGIPKEREYGEGQGYPGEELPSEEEPLPEEEFPEEEEWQEEKPTAKAPQKGRAFGPKKGRK